MIKTYYDKWESGIKMSDGITEMNREERIAMLADAFNNQVGGSHYKDMKIQPVEFITANNLSFLEGNVVKYIARHHAKNGADDVRKAIHYCELILRTVYND